MSTEICEESGPEGSEPQGLLTSVPTQGISRDVKIEVAKRAAQELIALANIQRVICVDDYYSVTTDDVFQVAAAIESSSLEAETLASIASSHPSLAPISDGLPSDLAAELVRSVWDSLDVDARAEISALVAQQLGNDDEGDDEPQGEDASALVTLRTLLADPPEFVTLTLDQWRRESSTLLGDGKPTLLLFDRSFEREGASSSAGEAEIQRILQGNYLHWKVALLTHTVTSPDEEIAAWRALTKEFSVDAAKFLVIAKGHLSQEPERFPAMLKLTLLVPALERMQEIVSSAIKETWDHALGEVQSKDPYTLETALNGSRHLDGTWGPDTLLRLISAFTQDRVMAELRKNSELHKHNASILQLNTVSIPQVRDQKLVQSELAEIQRMEFFKEAEHLSQLHLPVEAGDIFEVRKFMIEATSFGVGRSASPARAEIPCAETSKLYMLLGQPCDISVRYDGKRANDLDFLRLAPIRALPLESQAKVGGGGAHVFEIPFFDGETGAGVNIELNRIRLISAHALDFCVFGDGGVSSLGVGYICPDVVIPSWRERFTRLQKWVTKTVAQYQEMKPNAIAGKGANYVTSAITQSGTMPGLSSLISVSTQEVHYGIRRIGRLREPYRAAVLTRLAQRDSRDAFDVGLVD
ncbi:hypothetical protein [Streptomyces sp. NPDC001100]